MSYASLAFSNGRVFTGIADRPFVEAVAVSGERVLAVGTNSEIDEVVGPGSETVDLAGALVAPGFTDAHVPTATSGLEQLKLTFDGCDNASDALAAIARYVAENPDEPWILGGGWSQAWFDRGCPDARSLDAVLGDRPVLLTNADGHGAWANTRALEIAGITAATPDPTDGRIERLPDGTPQGTPSRRGETAGTAVRTRRHR